MPTDISNAVGTARQFTPQPDGSYQGRYQGVGASNGASSPTNALDELSQNMLRLDSALQNYTVNHEKYLDAKGHQEAQEMINGMSAGAIKALNTIDAAQLEGYVDSTANPYFTAYAEKLRGGFLSTQMKREYDDKYAMSPAKSMEEEARRYANFSDEWRKANLSGSNAPTNIYAFDTGFNENQLVNVAKLSDSWVQTKHRNDITTTMASATSKLGNVIENSVDLLKTNGAMTQAVQEVFNEVRLMGLPQEYRQKLLDDFAQEIVRTGHIDSTRLSQMMNNVVVSTNIDGSTEKASNLLDMQTYKTFAAQYNRQFMTQEKYDLVQNFIKSKDRKGALALIAQKRVDDPDHAQEYADLFGQIDGGIKQKEAEEKAEAARRLAEQQRQQKKSFEKRQDYDLCRAALKVHMSGGTMYNGQTLSSLKIDPQVAGQVLTESIDYAIGVDGNGNYKNQPDMSPFTRTRYVKNIMTFPSFSQAHRDIINNYMSDIDGIQPSSDGGSVYSQTAYNLAAMYQSNSGDFATAFGNELTTKVGTISLFASAHGGDLNAGLADYAIYAHTDKDLINDYENQASYQINGYTIEGMPVLGGGIKTASLSNSADATQMITKMAGALMSRGSSAWDAVNTATDTLKDSMLYFQGAFIPKGAFNNNCTPDDETYMFKALNRWCYQVASDGNADVRYDAREQIFYMSGDLDSKSFSLDDMRNRAYDVYAEEANAERPDSTDSVTAEAINAARESAQDAQEAEEASEEKHGTGLHAPL